MSQNHVLERALHSSGVLNQSKKRYRDELSRLMEQDQQLLRQENERLQTQVQSIHQDLLQSKEKVQETLGKLLVIFFSLFLPVADIIFFFLSCLHRSVSWMPPSRP